MIIVVSRKIEYDLKNEIYAKYQELQFDFYKDQRTGDLMNRISEDVAQVRMYLGPGVMYTANLIALFPLVLFQMIMLNAELTLYVLIPLPIMAFLIYLVSSRMNALGKEVQQEQSKLSTIAQETFSGMRVIKAYRQEDHTNRLFEKSSNEYLRRQMRLVRVNNLFMPTIMLLIGASSMLSVFIGGSMVLSGGIKTAIIVTFMMFIYKLTWPFASVGWVTSIIQRAAASQSRINDFLKTEPTIRTNVGEKIESFRTIRFNNVSFRYNPELPDTLKDINFELHKGQVLGIIGRTGSGKSTLLKLLVRQTDATKGSVLIDGKDLRSVDLNSYRSKSAVVPQDVFLFSDTIKNNILFGTDREDVEDSEIERVAEDAHVLHNIKGFPDQFDTLLGERGVNLSGGQKQRVSIARALIRKPKLLVLDDCLSAVDTETEEIILSKLDEYSKEFDTTVVIVSHRISSIRNADHILVLEDGEIVEQGTKEELLKKNGVFAEITAQQLLEDDSISGFEE
jgi:ATP-binding cassette subfamily B protein